MIDATCTCRIHAGFCRQVVHLGASRCRFECITYPVIRQSSAPEGSALKPANPMSGSLG